MQNYFFIKVFAGSDLGRQDPGRRPCTFPYAPVGLSALILGVMLLIFAPLPANAQEFAPEHVVFPITDFKPDIRLVAPLSMKFGTGFCLDAECRFVGTNYHVAKMMGKFVRIKGVFSLHRYLDSDAEDKGAQDIKVPGLGSLTFALGHDLAIYEMRHPIKNFHGIGFDEDDLEDSAEADIYAYPLNLNPKRVLVHWHGKFIGKTDQGLLAFSYEEGRVRGGASGGIVVSSRSKKIVGILNGMVEGGDRIALAVPVEELSDFVGRAEPYLQATLFPKTVFVSPVAVDFYRPYVSPHAGALSQRPVEPYEVAKLRFAAQNLAYSMSNFTATETFAWGHDGREPDLADAYETMIADGWQRWRRQGDKKFYDNVPFPPLNVFVVPGSEWADLPRKVGTEFHLKIHQAPDVLRMGRTIHVFQFAANVEDRACSWGTITNYIFFKRITSKFYDCHGEVWVDETGIILRISLTYDLSRPWNRGWLVVTYGWLKKDGTQHLVPLTISVEIENKNTYWCRGLFTDYGMFGVKARLIPATELEQGQSASDSK